MMIKLKKWRALAIAVLASFNLWGSAEAASNVRITQIPLSIPESFIAKDASVKFKASGPTLLFSDSPEMSITMVFYIEIRCRAGYASFIIT